MDINTILTHHGEEREKYFNAIAPPIIQTSNFAFDSWADMQTAFQDELGNHLYTRGNNPTTAILRKKLAALEGTEDALVFGSGAAAIAAAIIANVEAGDHIVCIRNPYGWTKSVLEKFLGRFHVTHTFVDGTDIENIEAAIQANTRLLFLESPNSATFELQDLQACAALARHHGIITAIDNSYCTPLYQQPAKLGIDIVLHSGSKYISGHSDVVVGVCCASKEMIQKIFSMEYMALGATLAPHDAAMVIRGLRTLPIRLQHIQETTAVVIDFLKGHEKVERVIYPFDKDFPQHELAQQQMSGGTGLFSILLKTEDLEGVKRFQAALERFLLAVSWGGYESLVLPFGIFTEVSKESKSGAPWNLVRLSIGLESADYLIADLKKGLEAM